MSVDFPLPIGPISEIAAGRGKPPPVILSRSAMPVGCKISCRWSPGLVFKEVPFKGKRHRAAGNRACNCNRGYGVKEASPERRLKMLIDILADCTLSRAHTTTE